MILEVKITMDQSKSSEALNKFYDYIKGTVNGCPNCEVHISYRAKTESCGIMVCPSQKENVSTLHIACNKEIISLLGNSVFYSDTTEFEFDTEEKTLTFKDKENNEVKIRE